jgi:hypothetical protein
MGDLEASQPTEQKPREQAAESPESWLESTRSAFPLAERTARIDDKHRAKDACYISLGSINAYLWPGKRWRCALEPFAPSKRIFCQREIWVTPVDRDWSIPFLPPGIVKIACKFKANLAQLDAADRVPEQIRQSSVEG